MIQPDIQGSVIRNCDPEGCHDLLREEWNRLNRRSSGETFQSVLVIGCSSGFGLASRLVTLRNGAQYSIGVCFERGPSENSQGSAGWHLDQAYQSLAMDQIQRNLTFNQDAFLPETKQAVINEIRSLGIQIDLVVYSVAAGLKFNEKGEKIRSSILPIGQEISGFQVDLSDDSLSPHTLPPATDRQIADTVTVMGGQDWYDWMVALRDANVLTTDCQTYNYSYLGTELSAPMYSKGTLGAAKKHMHETAERLREEGFNANVVVCKALVTKASLFIPLMAPYLMALKAELILREQEEDIFDQMRRLFSGAFVSDDQDIRLDTYEQNSSVQEGVRSRLEQLTPKNLKDIVDYEGVRNELLKLHGFDPTTLK